MWGVKHKQVGPWYHLPVRETKNQIFPKPDRKVVKLFPLCNFRIKTYEFRYRRFSPGVLGVRVLVENTKNQVVLYVSLQIFDLYRSLQMYEYNV